MFILLLVIIFGLICLLDYYKRQYWKQRGVHQVTSIPFFGNFFPVLMQEFTTSGLYERTSRECKERGYFGIYEFWRPVLVVKDIEFMKHILIKDFSNFLDHPRWIFDDRSVMAESLLNMKGNRWRALRYQTISWFTTARMKSLFPDVLRHVTLPMGEIKVKPFLRNITANCIAAFLGVQINNMEELQTVNKKFHDVSNFRYYKLILIERFGIISDNLGIKFEDFDTNNYIKNFIKAVLKNENHSLVQRFNKLLEQKVVYLRNKDLHTKSTQDKIYSFEVTDRVIENILAQFLLAGLDTTSNTLSWAIVDLTLNPDAQAKARNEIRRTVEKFGGWTYEAVNEMKYLANCLIESMRLHPVLAFMFRTCTTTYKAKDGLIIDEGTKIIIPVSTIHMDPEFYPEPEKFKPERFGDVEKQTNLLWLPFGEGPRKCAGMRFAQMVMRVTIGKLLENHEIVFTENQIKSPTDFDNKTFLSRPLNELYITLKAVK